MESYLPPQQTYFPFTFFFSGHRFSCQLVWFFLFFSFYPNHLVLFFIIFVHISRLFSKNFSSMKQNYRGNSRAWNGCSIVGFTRCFLVPRWLPWLILVFLCQVLCSSRAWPSWISSVFLEWTDMKEVVAKTRRKRIKHVISEALTWCWCTILLFLVVTFLVSWEWMKGGLI